MYQNLVGFSLLTVVLVSLIKFLKISENDDCFFLILFYENLYVVLQSILAYSPHLREEIVYCSLYDILVVLMICGYLSCDTFWFILSRRKTSCLSSEIGRLSGNYLQKLASLFLKTIEEASSRSIVTIRSLVI